MIKTLALLTLALVLVSPVRAEKFEYDTGHASIDFSVRHLLVSKAKGTFTEFDGGIEYDIANKSLVSISAVVKTKSVDTNNEKRDKHLRNEDFFNVEKYPEMTFSSTKITKNEDGSFAVTGDFTLLETTKEVTFTAELNGPVEDPWKNTRIGLEFELKIDRTDYGMTYGTSSVGKEVEIDVAVEATLKK